MIKTCTYDSKCKASFRGELSNELPVITGPRQGDALSLALLIITLKLVMGATKSYRQKQAYNMCYNNAIQNPFIHILLYKVACHTCMQCVQIQRAFSLGAHFSCQEQLTGDGLRFFLVHCLFLI